MLANIFKPKPEADQVQPPAAERPAATAFKALRTRSAALQQEDGTWAEREQSAIADIRAHEETVARLHSFEDKHLQAVADREVGLPNAIDPDRFQIRIDEERARAERLGARRKIADRMLVSIRAERSRIRTEQTALAQQHAAHLHAAVVEHLRSLAPEFLAAERQYVDALSKIFGASRLADRIGREMIQAGQSHPGWVGDLDVRNLVTPRPAGDAFRPVPQRDALHQAIEAEAARLLEEFK